MSIKCSYVETPEMHKELRWKTLNWPLIIGVMFVPSAMIVALIFLGIKGIAEDNTLLSVYCFVMAATFFFPSMLFLWTVIKHLRVSKKCREVNIVFDNDQIALHGKKEIDFRPYCLVKKIKETKNFFLIIMRDERKELSYLPVKKDALSCTPEELKSFVAQKMSESKRKEWRWKF